MNSRNVLASIVLCMMVYYSSASATWNKIAQFSGMGRVSACYFFDEQIGLVGFNGPVETFKMMRTVDGGTTWSAVSTPPFGNLGKGTLILFSKIWFKNATDGWATFMFYGGAGGGLWKTTDAGLHWTTTNFQNTATSVWETSKALMVASIDQGFFVSTDGGATFSSSLFRDQLCMAFTDDLHGACTSDRQGQFHYTQDGGRTWMNSNLANEEAWGIYALAGTKTFVVAPEFGTTDIYRSNDYGATWKTVATPAFQSMGDIIGVDSVLFVQNDVFMGRGAPGLYRSTDLGSTWVSIGGPNQFYDARLAIVHNCSESTVLFAFDTSGGVWKSSDGGDGSGFASAALHRAIQSGSPGDTVTLPLSVDLNGTLDSVSQLWMQISFDSSQLSFVGYTPPLGHTVVYIQSGPTTVSYSISQSGNALSGNLALGDLTFEILHTPQGESQVFLNALRYGTPSGEKRICLGQSEDGYWAVHILSRADIAEKKEPDLRIFPNPFSDHLTMLGMDAKSACFELLDLMGNEVLKGSGSEIPTAVIPAGSYFLICHASSRIKVFHVTKPR